MAKDSQLDPKDVRRQKSKGGPTHAYSAPDNEGRNRKKQSANALGPELSATNSVVAEKVERFQSMGWPS